MKTSTNKFNHWRKELVTIPDWAIGEIKDCANLITAVALAGFEGKWIRLSAAQQRQIIGRAMLGKMAFRCTASTVTVTKKLCFGMDWELTDFTAAKFNEALRGNHAAI